MNNPNFYELLGVNPNSKSNEIIDAYKNKINKFTNINNFNNQQIHEIKLLKKGLYILINRKLRKKYNSCIGFNKEPIAMNDIIDDSFDAVFNVDNSWMNKHKNINNDKKNNAESDVISNRIFGLSSLNKKPGYSTNDEIYLRKPLQGRVDKTIE
jgi:DnaJ-class molecular chaperone